MTNNLQTSRYLYQSPLYRAPNGEWTASFFDALGSVGTVVTWDSAAILGIIGNGYVWGNRTLVSKVSRRPWLSQVKSDGDLLLEEIPLHGTLWQTPREIASNLRRLLCEEAQRVCHGRDEIYLLLSGGLDSRIVAGVLATLARAGELQTNPVAVTWGLRDSRDVCYARLVAQACGFDPIHVDLGPEDLAYNVEVGSLSVAAMVSPIHLHGMRWFETVSASALVLAASYGDSVGRAEFSGRHLLELDYLQPRDPFGLLKSSVAASALGGLMQDRHELWSRSLKAPRYIVCEHEMQAHYMRNMIAHAMSMIGQRCCIYQMFTHPDVYSYIWRTHPSRRGNAIYAELLEQLDLNLARLPWARTNHALRGRTVGSRPDLRRSFHTYASWLEGPLYARYAEVVDPGWFASTGLFTSEGVQRVRRLVAKGNGGKGPYGDLPHQVFLWLASFRRFAEYLENLGLSPEPRSTLHDKKVHNVAAPRKIAAQAVAKRILSHAPYIYSLMGFCLRNIKKMRLWLLKLIARIRLPGRC